MSDLLSLSYDELVGLLESCGEPRFRPEQIWGWLYRHQVRCAQEMTNLPLALRQRLDAEAHIVQLGVLSRQVSEDGHTEKVLFGTEDGHAFEAVLMRYRERNTVCASSQIGCALGCEFCATGRDGLVRNLTAGEIVAQVLHFCRTLAAEGRGVTNIVLMGMGEPLLNYDAVWRAIQNLSDSHGLGLGSRRFTISTVGIIPGIRRLAREGASVGLAVSLHAPDDNLRDRLVPINRRYPIDDLLEAVQAYIEATGRRPTFEYVLVQELNDSVDQAQRLARILQGMLCHVNLIPFNPTGDRDWQPSPPERIAAFQAVLEKHHIPTTVRLSRGRDIMAACGQLRAARARQGLEVCHEL